MYKTASFSFFFATGRAFVTTEGNRSIFPLFPLFMQAMAWFRIFSWHYEHNKEVIKLTHAGTFKKCGELFNHAGFFKSCGKRFSHVGSFLVVRDEFYLYGLTFSAPENA